MRSVSRLLLGALLLGGTGIIVAKFVVPKFGRAGPPAGPPAVEAGVEGLPAGFVKRVETASDPEAADLLRAAHGRYTLPRQRAEFSQLKKQRGKLARANLERAIESMLEESRCADAIAAVQRFERGWGTTDLLAGIRAEQKRRIDERLREADTLVEEGRYVAAREACLPPAGLFEASAIVAFTDHGRVIERRIRVRSYRSDRHVPIADAAPVPAPTAARPAPPPSLPGAPHADVKRLGEARALLRRMSKLFRTGQYGPLVKATENLTGYFGDLGYVKRRNDGLEAILSFARYRSNGIKGLFHATEVHLLGAALQLTYRFEERSELLDWEELKPIPHAKGGKFEPARRGVRGTGVAALSLRAFFENNVTLSCVSKPQQPRSHGLAFLEAGNEQRQVILLATNHWFTEGENYVKKRPGHSILLIGKGVNNDVPVDSPEVGFVFKGPSYARPSPPASAEIDLKLTMTGNRVQGEVRYRGDSVQLGVSALGDDGRGFSRHRPTLFVIEAGVIFREVKVRGKLHPEFAREREGELLDLAESAFEGVE